MRTVKPRGRLIWGVSGLVTLSLLFTPAFRFFARAGDQVNASPGATVTQTLTVTQPVTSLNLQTYGAMARVTAVPGHEVQVIETISYGLKQGEPNVTHKVSHGTLTLADPAATSPGAASRSAWSFHQMCPSPRPPMAAC